MTHSKEGQKKAVTAEQEMMQLIDRDIRMIVTIILHGFRGGAEGRE